MIALFIESIVLARILGAASFGDYAVILTMITIFAGSISIKTQEALTKVLSTPWGLPIKIGKEYIALALTLDLALKVIIGMILYFVMLIFLNQFVEGDIDFNLIAIVAASSCIFSFPNNVWNSIARLENSFILIAALPLAFPILRLLAVFFFIPFDNPSVESLILIYGITIGFMCLLQSIWIWHRSKSVGFGFLPNNSLRDFWSNNETLVFLDLVKTAFFISPITSVLKNIDVLALGYLGTSGEVGVYKVAKSAAGTLSGIQSILSNIIFRNVVQAESDGGLMENFWQTTKALPKIYGTLALPFSLILVVGTYLLPLIFGEQFSGAALPFWILGFGFFLSAGLFWVVSFVLALERFGAYRKMMWANASVSLLLIIALTNWYGLLGAAMGTAMAYVLGHLVFFAFLHHHFETLGSKRMTKI